MTQIRKQLNNGNGHILVIILAIIAGAIAFQTVRSDCNHNTASAAELKVKVEQVTTDVEVEKEKVDALRRHQEKYNADMALNTVFQAATVVKIDNIEVTLERILKKLEE